MDGKILFVEDDEDDAFLIQRACRDAGIEDAIEFLPNGRAALEYFSDAACAFRGASLRRLIFLDLNMPLMGGIEFLKWLRKQPELQYIPVVILTSSDNPQDLTAAYRAGANGYLVKPNAVSEFAEMLDCATRFWLRHNHA